MITLLVDPALLLIHHCHYRDTEMEEKKGRKEGGKNKGRKKRDTNGSARCPTRTLNMFCISSSLLTKPFDCLNKPNTYS